MLFSTETINPTAAAANTSLAMAQKKKWKKHLNSSLQLQSFLFTAVADNKLSSGDEKKDNPGHNCGKRAQATRHSPFSQFKEKMVEKKTTKEWGGTLQ